MSVPTAARLLRHAGRTTSGIASHRIQLQPKQLQFLSARPLAAATAARTTRCFATSPNRKYAGLMPDTHDPQPPQNEPEQHATQATDISPEEYQEHADRYMDSLHEKAEAIQESREDVEVEYSAGVLSITLPPNGTYVINKQPPNKQIWLSSPLSGPKRFDWVMSGESMHQKQGGGVGDWIYLRDGTKLTEVLSKELGISVTTTDDVEAQTKPSIDPVE